VSLAAPSSESEAADCSETEHGCCADGMSAATGRDLAGCPQQKDAVPHGYCVDTEFGCCRDGVTAARGPNQLGCPDLLCYVSTFLPRAGFKGGPVGPGPRPPTKPFIFYFSLTVDAYET